MTRIDLADPYQPTDPQTQPKNGLLSNLSVLNGFFKALVIWLAPTREDQEDAGIYLGGGGRG